MEAERWIKQLEMMEKVKQQVKAREKARAAEEERTRQEAEKRAWIRELVNEMGKASYSVKGGGDENGMEADTLSNRGRA